MVGGGRAIPPNPNIWGAGRCRGLDPRPAAGPGGSPQGREDRPRRPPSLRGGDEYPRRSAARTAPPTAALCALALGPPVQEAAPDVALHGARRDAGGLPRDLRRGPSRSRGRRPCFLPRRSASVFGVAFHDG